MAIGGYTTAILVSEHGVRDLWTIPIAALVAGLAGFIVGVPCAAAVRASTSRSPPSAWRSRMPAILSWDKLDCGHEERPRDPALQQPALMGKGFEDVHFLGRTLPFNHAVYYLTWEHRARPARRRRG
jgi:hypothetical protein